MELLFLKLKKNWSQKIKNENINYLFRIKITKFYFYSPYLTILADLANVIRALNASNTLAGLRFTKHHNFVTNKTKKK